MRYFKKTNKTIFERMCTKKWSVGTSLEFLGITEYNICYFHVFIISANFLIVAPSNLLMIVDICKHGRFLENLEIGIF